MGATRPGLEALKAKVGARDLHAAGSPQLSDSDERELMLVLAAWSGLFAGLVALDIFLIGKFVLNNYILLQHRSKPFDGQFGPTTLRGMFLIDQSVPRSQILN